MLPQDPNALTLDLEPLDVTDQLADALSLALSECSINPADRIVLELAPPSH